MANPLQRSIERDDRRCLEEFVFDNTDLERLELLLDQFNLFEALGYRRQELRHSDVLAFVLNPGHNHGLRDMLVKRLLQRVLVDASHHPLPVSLIDLDVWDLSQAMVLREWENIDVFLVDEDHRFVLIIENKIDSNEHSNQLQRYWKTVEQHYPGWKMIGLLLTPTGKQPSDPRYLPISYGLICDILESLIERQRAQVHPDVCTFIMHYAHLLRRHIVEESEIAKLCQRLYLKHQRALDLIYEHREARQKAIQAIVNRLVEETPGLTLDQPYKHLIRVTVNDWNVATLKVAHKWTPSQHILLFEFINEPTELRLTLMLGRGPEATRRLLFELAIAHQPPFKDYGKGLERNWNWLYDRLFLTKESYDKPTQDLEHEIHQQWNDFIANDLSRIKHVLRGEPRIWQHSLGTEVSRSVENGTDDLPEQFFDEDHDSVGS